MSGVTAFKGRTDEDGETHIRLHINATAEPVSKVAGNNTRCESVGKKMRVM